MKVKIAIVALIGISGVAFASMANACYYHEMDGTYRMDGVRTDVKTDVKKTDKGVQVNITSDDPKVAREIQNRNSRNRRHAANQNNDTQYWGSHSCPYMDCTDHYVDRRDHSPYKCTWGY